MPDSIDGLNGKIEVKVPSIAFEGAKEHAARRTPVPVSERSSSAADIAVSKTTPMGVAVQLPTPSLMVVAGPDVGAVAHLQDAMFLVGRDPSCQLQLKDESVSRFHISIKQGPEGSLIIRDLNSTNGTYIAGKRIHTERLREGDKILLGQNTLIRFQKLGAVGESDWEQLYHTSTRDGVTGAYNQRACLEKIATDLAYAKRRAAPCSLILFNIDCFKRVNDMYGHPTGDLVLSATAKTVSSTIRTEDVFGRYQGEEFIVFGLDTNLLGASSFAERIRDSVERQHVVANDGTRRIVRVTVSLGIAATSAPHLYSVDHLLSEAGSNLHQAKVKGRNCVVASEIFA
jgi:two-component system, cell cycle response regulator